MVMVGFKSRVLLHTAYTLPAKSRDKLFRLHSSLLSFSTHKIYNTSAKLEQISNLDCLKHMLIIYFHLPDFCDPMECWIIFKLFQKFNHLKWLKVKNVVLKLENCRV